MSSILTRNVFFALFVGAALLIFFGIGPAKASETRDQYGYLHVEAPAVAEIIANSPEVIILDIRTPSEFQQGHIKGAVNVDYYAADFEEKIAALDPSARYVLHCRSGSRSSKALSILSENKLENVTHLRSGIIGWTGSGYPLNQE